MSNVLVVDDNVNVCKDLKKQLEKRGYMVHTASTVEEAGKFILSEVFNYAIIDLKLDIGEYVGNKVFTFAKRNQPKVKSIVLSAYRFDDIKDQLKREFQEEYESEKILKEIEENYISKNDKRNYILAVLEKLEELAKKIEVKKCFVIMPFSTTKTCQKDEWTEIFKKVITPAVEKSGFNYKCERANIQYGSIIWEILDKLNRSELVIADITDRNTNVLYELGVRHALGGPTIAIAQNKDDIPYDLTPYPFKIYGWKTDKEKKDFKKEIKKAIADLEKNPRKAISPVRKYLDLIKADSK